MKTVACLHRYNATHCIVLAVEGWGGEAGRSSQRESSRSTIAAAFLWKHCGIVEGVCSLGGSPLPPKQRVELILGMFCVTFRNDSNFCCPAFPTCERSYLLNWLRVLTAMSQIPTLVNPSGSKNDCPNISSQLQASVLFLACWTLLHIYTANINSVVDLCLSYQR